MRIYTDKLSKPLLGMDGKYIQEEQLKGVNWDNVKLMEVVKEDPLELKEYIIPETIEEKINRLEIKIATLEIKVTTLEKI
jgi:hypothetical protein